MAEIFNFLNVGKRRKRKRVIEVSKIVNFGNLFGFLVSKCGTVNCVRVACVTAKSVCLRSTYIRTIRPRNYNFTAQSYVFVFPLLKLKSSLNFLQDKMRGTNWKKSFDLVLLESALFYSCWKRAAQFVYLAMDWSAQGTLLCEVFSLKLFYKHSKASLSNLIIFKHCFHFFETRNKARI